MKKRILGKEIDNCFKCPFLECILGTIEDDVEYVCKTVNKHICYRNDLIIIPDDIVEYSESVCPLLRQDEDNLIITYEYDGFRYKVKE